MYLSSDGTKNYTVAESAKFIREALKQAFPGIKFSVTSSNYSGGGSVTVQWTDGPTSAAVERVCYDFEGASFDGMQDLKTYHDRIVNGEKVHYGNDWTSCNRRFSKAFLEKVIDAYCARYRAERPEIKVSRDEKGQEYASIDTRHPLHDDIMPLASDTDARELETLRVGIVHGRLAVLREEPEAE